VRKAENPYLTGSLLSFRILPPRWHISLQKEERKEKRGEI
jgi:hypothetical protein